MVTTGSQFILEKGVDEYTDTQDLSNLDILATKNGHFKILSPIGLSKANCNGQITVTIFTFEKTFRNLSTKKMMKDL